VTGIYGASLLLIALPLAGAIVLLLGGRLLDRIGHLVGCATVIAAFCVGVAVFATLLGEAPDDRIHNVEVFTWMSSGSLTIDFGLLLDPLSVTFVLLITGVGSLIHIYSIGYMSHDADRRKFFAYLNLFVAAMLLLVLGNSFVTLYAGWEGVGLASYLLIGFWSDRPAAATAAKKAFIMNRVGDVGLALAIFLMFKEMGTVSFIGVFARIGELADQSPGTVTVMALLLLLGACGKSGQVPLQAWLPDAMEGPTPVSALIHAATMVTAGVYLIARCSPIYDLTADGGLVVAIIGAVTLLVGCIGGCAKDDIKKVLAYSTVSQIGYMFLAVGLGAGVYALGILLLLCHGFFKAGLFLGAGSIMHAMNDDVDMRRYGGLARRMPITFVTMSCAYLAIIGFPLFDGFYAKDPIIEAAFAAEGAQGLLLGSAALIGAGITAFYMTRLMIMTFFGEPRWKELQSADGRDYHPHESPLVMTVPMIILAVGSVGAGAFLAIGDRLANWLAPSVGPYEHPEPPVPAIVITVATLAIVAVGVFIAYWFIGRRPVPVAAPMPVSPVVALARADVGGNAVNEALFARPGIWLSRASVYADAKGIDGAVNGTAAALGGLSGRWRHWQNGFVRSYALSMFAGTLVVIVMLLLVRIA
jgi:NADH-quinone oxidoreductase subunit L